MLIRNALDLKGSTVCARYVVVLNEDGIGELVRTADLTREWLLRLEQEGRVHEVGEGPKPRYSSYNVAPTHRMPVVLNEDGERALTMARWGFIPAWWRKKDPPRFATFNARDDKLKSSGIWKGAIDRRRCLVPASGFYEWEKKGKERLPYYIHRSDGRLMGFAGLYSRFKDPDSGEEAASFTIVTTPTNGFMEPLHDRIPLILGDVADELWSVWLDPQTSFEEVERHVASREWPEMAMHRVSTDVNPTGKARYVNEPRLIEPVEPEEQQASLL